MATALDDLKSHARILHRLAQGNDPGALSRLTQHRELEASEESTLAQTVRRRHCLGVIAQELGFGSWAHAAAVLAGGEERDFGTLLYPRGGDAHSNIWSASYEEARKIHRQHGGFLLTYRRQFFIAERPFIETLGLDPEDPDWELIGRDWARPAEDSARDRLYRKLFAKRLPYLGPQPEGHRPRG